MTTPLADEKHLTPDELEWVIGRLATIVERYGTLGVEEALAEMKRRVIEEGESYGY